MANNQDTLYPIDAFSVSEKDNLLHCLPQPHLANFIL